MRGGGVLDAASRPPQYGNLILFLLQGCIQILVIFFGHLNFNMQLISIYLNLTMKDAWVGMMEGEVRRRWLPWKA